MCFEFNAEPPISPQSGSAARGEDIVLESADGTRFLAYVAHTSTPAKAGIIVLPDARGLFHFYKELALRFAEAGIETVAIDYFGRTAGLTDRDQDFDFWPHVMEARRETLDADIAAAAAYLRGLPNAPQSLFTVGFCFGGSNSFLQACSNPGLAGVIGFYGRLAGPSRDGSPTALERASAFTIPVLGLFGGADPAIAAEHRQQFDEGLDKAGVAHEIITYPDAPHSFFDRTQAEYAKESADAWKRILGFVAAHTKA